MPRMADPSWVAKGGRPEIRTPPPGPKARAVLERDRRYASPSYTRDLPFVMDRGQAVWVWDADGNRYLDFTSGVAVTNVGHGHPEILRVVREQSERFLHMAGADFYYGVFADLCARLCEISPGRGPKKVFLTNSGTEAVEAALKLARYATRRPRFLAFFGGFHGRTMGALAFTSSKAVQREGFSPLMSEVTHVPYPDPRGVFRGRPENAVQDCLDYIEKLVFRRIAPPGDIAAVLVEPVQGEGGYIVPPPDFLPRLRELCGRHGILLILDEIQTGFGRTGAMFAAEHSGVVPDILCVAKGIANGLPLGAMIARADLHTWPAGAHANTFGGNPVACAVALKVIDLLENGLIENAVSVGAYLAERLDAVASRCEAITERRGLGLMQAVEFTDPEKRQTVLRRCFERGLVLLGCGDSAIRFIPPLIVTREHVDVAVELFEESL